MPIIAFPELSHYVNKLDIVFFSLVNSCFHKGVPVFFSIFVPFFIHGARILLMKNLQRLLLWKSWNTQCAKVGAANRRDEDSRPEASYCIALILFF